VSDEQQQRREPRMTLLSTLPTLLLVAQLPPCAVTPTVPLLPGIVNSAAGTEPAWLVTDNPITWAATGMKTLWVFKATGGVRVTGREVRSGSTVRFQRGFGNPITVAMTIDNLRLESVLPGGANRELLDTYTFHPSAVFYPDPGCYRFDIHVHQSTRHITVQVR
jgi:hypothetical protein